MLPAGTMLGPYRIAAAIGAGGMGEVYRATDTRLGRDVAVKVLSRSLTHDPESQRRFEQEARSAGMLNHPNILSIYDIGTEGDTRYIVSELLEGESLRARIRQSAIPPRKALDYAGQIARGLAAAHERGIIHRDLKPENLFVTRDGLVKILDFGLAKLIGPRVPGVGDEHSVTLPGTPTEPGRLLGTVGYMAPEQVRGGQGDHRSDIFAFGAILYEMLAGRQAFRGESPIETLNSILKDDPSDFFELNIRVPAALDRVVRHCLEKSPDERFQSTRDLAFDLGSLSGLTSQAISHPAHRPQVAWKSMRMPLIVAGIILAIAVAAFLIGRRFGTQPPPAFKRLTFRSGTISDARFSPDGQSVFYSARWAGGPLTIYSARQDSPESRDMGLNGADVIAISPNGQLAISLRRHPIGYLRASGTLAQVPIGGGAPRELLDDVETADWMPDGKSLAVVRSIEGRCRLEYPIGTVLYETEGWITSPRVSPRGNAIAFLDHPFINDDRGSVAVIELPHGKRKTITNEWQSVQGLAWTPDARELWFAAEDGATPRAIRAVSSAGGTARLVASSAGPLVLDDISSTGRVLATRENLRSGIIAMTPGEPPRDLSWLDFSVARDLSADGRTVAFSESGEAGGSIYGVYLRSTDGSPAIRLGDGTTEALSPDGRWVLSVPRNRKPAPVIMLPTGAGEPRVVTHDAMNHRNARFSPDGTKIVFQGSAPNEASRVWIQDVAGGPPRPITPPGVAGTQITPDGSKLLGRAEDRRFYFYPIAGGTPQPVTAVHGSDVPVRFSDDGKSVFVATFASVPALLYKVDLATGARTVWTQAMPADPSGLISVGPILTTPDGKTTVYSFARQLSDLYLVEAGRRRP